MDPVSAAFVGLRLGTQQLLATLAPPPRPAFTRDGFGAVRDRAFHWMRAEIRHRYRPGDAPPARRVELRTNVYLDRFELIVTAYDGRSSMLDIHETRSLSRASLDYVGFERICLLYWDVEAEAFNNSDFYFDWRNHNELLNRVADAERGLPPRATIEEGYRFAVLDMASAVDATATIVQRRSLLTGAVVETAYDNLTATQVRLMQQAMVREIERAYSYGGGRHQGRTFSQELQQNWFFDAEPADREANARGETLLREWLSPEQRRQYEAKRHFDVTGNATRKRYRIKHGRVQNVWELGSDGREVCGLCFAPAGDLVPGDVMLAQKIALETDEEATLKVANRFGPGAARYYEGRLFGGRVVDAAWVDELYPIPREWLRDLEFNAVRPGVTGAPAARPEPVVVDSRSWTGLT